MGEPLADRGERLLRLPELRLDRRSIPPLRRSRGGIEGLACPLKVLAHGRPVGRGRIGSASGLLINLLPGHPRLLDLGEELGIGARCWRWLRRGHGR